MTESITWLDDILSNATTKSRDEHSKANSLETQLITSLIERCNSLFRVGTTQSLGRLLASAFDLVVAADYYSSVAHKGWFYCRAAAPKLFYHYTNCCPRHAISNQFYFNLSGKPGSGNIGKSTSRLLRRFISILLEQSGHQEEVLSGIEPVDVVIVNRDKKKVFFGEIKASPLVTLPLAVNAEEFTAEREQAVEIVDHARTDNPYLFKSKLHIFLPVKTRQGKWAESYYNLGSRGNATDSLWAQRSLLALLSGSRDFFKNYVSFWDEALNCYHPKSTQSIFWLTNASGAPTPRPDDWPRRTGGEGEGYETVSDSKTSVGMDRTDDIKKGIYQVLKLGAEGKALQSQWELTVGIMSNIHPARHFDEYLKSLRDLVWTTDSSGAAKIVGDLPDDQSIFNLFDGIITLTHPIYRNDWLRNVFSFLNAR
jgi:hypothetical protein